MYLVIMGGGTIGSPLAAALISAGHEVFVIDTDRARTRAIEQSLGSVATHGDATRVPVLEQAGTSRAAIFIATTSHDHDNLAACQLARGHFNVPRVIAIANKPENALLFELAGVDIVVSKTDLMLASLSGALPAHPLIRLMPVMGRNQEVVGVKIPGGARIVGSRVGDVALPYGAQMLLRISREGQATRPDADTVLEGEDEVLVYTPSEAAQELWELLTELR